jgi:hypothetical protein
MNVRTVYCPNVDACDWDTARTEHDSCPPVGRMEEWWRGPFHIDGGRAPQHTLHGLEALLGEHFAEHPTEFFPRGDAAAGARPRRLPLGQALARARNGSGPAYTFLQVPPARWGVALRALGVREPSFVSNRGHRPEGECAAALIPANRTWQFERDLRWRMIALAWGAAGMHLHRDSLPLATWHVQDNAADPNPFVMHHTMGAAIPSCLPSNMLDSR